ncbi:uncharacterized protein LOC26535658 isoform X1 [Drosophila yakuba]|uniref:Uncharacterized protein, isoform B n=1 Tax=Drosophila yakuba TaxID=7245 RepID=A0A0R1DR59_DROYA|nr:uncharacterized protein LOC26535658 isoform X1 [Drosophila yakuba]KRJ99743.1 uncharacterized protein Dyak_GE28477, isoform B [Drosophila yakuba]
MSLVLDVIQQVVLQKAYDLTCEAAILALRKCGKLKIEDDKSKGKHEKPLPPIKPTSQEVVLPLKTPRLPEPVIIQKYTGRDMPRKNFGSIDPPQCSCMRVCRDSYFS